MNRCIIPPTVEGWEPKDFLRDLLDLHSAGKDLDGYDGPVMVLVGKAWHQYLLLPFDKDNPTGDTLYATIFKHNLFSFIGIQAAITGYGVYLYKPYITSE